MGRVGFIKSTFSDKNKTILGIDLGTTNSLASYLENGKPVVIGDEDGKFSTPSIVNFGKNIKVDKKEDLLKVDKNGDLLKVDKKDDLNNVKKLLNIIKVGHKAKELLLTDPKNTIFASKRLIGRKIDDEIFKIHKDYLNKLPYDTIKKCNGDVMFKTDHGNFTPVEIAAKVLGHIKKFIFKKLNKDITTAVITVPAYFNDNQRQATKDAGRIAGFNVARVINEPTAAALAYGLDKKENGTIAVYDLGGGTFDITILEIENGIFHVKSTNGNTFLGGEDFDNEFVHFLTNLFHQKEGIDIEKLENSKEILNKLKIEAEKAKKILSDKFSTEIFIDNVIDGIDLDLEITRSQFESIIKKVANKTIEPCKMALKDAQISDLNKLDHVILVGGMTRLPYIRNLVKDIFGKEPDTTTVNPDEAIAKGAAIQGGIMSGEVKDLLLLDVIPLSLGIETLGGIFSKVINKNSTIPFKQTETFSTSKDNQSEVMINIYQGERTMVNGNKYLGQLILSGIETPSERGVPKINVTFEADADGLLKVYAEDSLTKKSHSVVIKPASGYSETELNKLIKDTSINAIKNEEIDKENKEKAELKIKIISELEFFMNINEEIKLPNSLKEKMKKLKMILNNNENNFEINEVKNKYKEIENEITM